MNIYQLNNLYIKANPSEQESKILNLYFHSGSVGMIFDNEEKMVQPPFKVFDPKKSGLRLYPMLTGVKVPRETITTGLRLEKMLLALFTSTNFENIKDPKNIQRGRYLVDFYQLNPSLLEMGFNYILGHKNPRISKSWLEPMQERIIKGTEPRIRAKKKLKGFEAGVRFDDEPEEAVQLPDSFTSDYENAISKAVQSIRKKGIDRKYYIPKPHPWPPTPDIPSSWYTTTVQYNTAGIPTSTTPVEEVTDPTWPINGSTIHGGRANSQMSISTLLQAMPKNSVYISGNEEFFKDNTGHVRSRMVTELHL